MIPLQEQVKKAGKDKRRKGKGMEKHGNVDGRKSKEKIWFWLKSCIASLGSLVV